jgi:hypothetical protein
MSRGNDVTIDYGRVVLSLEHTLDALIKTCESCGHCRPDIDCLIDDCETAMVINEAKLSLMSANDKYSCDCDEINFQSDGE